MWLAGFEISVTRHYSPCPASNKYHIDAMTELRHIQIQSGQTPLTVRLDSEPSLLPVLPVIYSQYAHNNLIPVPPLPVFRLQP
jgi:hypothetical protein